MIIRLELAERKLAQFLATGRANANRKRGSEDRKQGPQNGLIADLDGVGAELAFAKAHNLYPDLSLDGAPKADCTGRWGETIDVKTTRYASGRLLAVPWKRADPCDIYCLVKGVFPDYEITGIATRAELFADENLTDLGHGPTYALRVGR